MLLETKKVSKAFGGLMANNEIDFSIKEGEIVAIIGPNGSGKTTFYNLLTGISPATSGSITFKGKDITRCKPEEITKMGISRTFQNIRLFGNMTVSLPKKKRSSGCRAEYEACEAGGGRE